MFYVFSRERIVAEEKREEETMPCRGGQRTQQQQQSSTSVADRSDQVDDTALTNLDG
jgi:hypothetical protein